MPQFPSRIDDALNGRRIFNFYDVYESMKDKSKRERKEKKSERQLDVAAPQLHFHLPSDAFGCGIKHRDEWMNAVRRSWRFLVRSFTSCLCHELLKLHVIKLCNEDDDDDKNVRRRLKLIASCQWNPAYARSRLKRTNMMENLIAIENINVQAKPQPRVAFVLKSLQLLLTRSLVDSSYFPTIVALMLSNFKCARRRGFLLQLKI